MANLSKRIDKKIIRKYTRKGEGMLQQGNRGLSPMPDTGRSEMSRERCKPNYEEMINNLKARQEKAEVLANALIDYTGYVQLQDELAEMYGELMSEIVSLNFNIEKLIAEQEVQEKE